MKTVQDKLTAIQKKLKNLVVKAAHHAVILERREDGFGRSEAALKRNATRSFRRAKDFALAHGATEEAFVTYYRKFYAAALAKPTLPEIKKIWSGRYEVKRHGVTYIVERGSIHRKSLTKN